jgi:hypothetical protein
MRIETACIFLNVSSPFNVLNGLCTGEVEYQAIFVEDKDGEMVLDCLEVMDIVNITFAGNELEGMNHEEFCEWTKQVNGLMKCDIKELMYEDAEANVDNAYLLEYASKIQIPNQKPNRNCCCC